MTSWLSRLFASHYNQLPTSYGSVEINTDNYLPRNTETLVIGGGLAGLSTALELSQAGKNVVVVDAADIFGRDSASQRSGGQLWPGFEGTLSGMQETFGDSLANALWSDVHRTLGKIHHRLAAHPERCGFQPGVLLTSKTEEDAEWIKEEYKVFQQAGFGWADYLSGEQVRQYVATDAYLNGLLYSGAQGQNYGHLNPAQYSGHIASLARKAGAKLVAGCKVDGLYRWSRGYVATTSCGSISAKNVVLATGAEFSRPNGLPYTDVSRSFVKAQTYILATEPMPEETARSIVPGTACFCDAADAAMNYGRLVPTEGKPGYWRLTFGGADALAQVIQPALEIPRIEKEMYHLFPQLHERGIKVGAVWGGNCDLSRTGLPSITNSAEGLYSISGFSGQGMVTTALYGEAAAQAIQGSRLLIDTLAKINPEPFHPNPAVALAQAYRTHMLG